MELDSESKEKLSKQPFIMRKAVDYLLSVINTIINGDCDESTVISTMGTLNQNAQGRYSDDDLLNYDKACKVLGFSVTNRVGLKRLLDKNGIKQVIIHNTPCGFRRDEIMALRDKINEEVKKRELKQKKKNEREAQKLRQRYKR